MKLVRKYTALFYFLVGINNVMVFGSSEGNQIPVVTNFVATADVTRREVSITYDLLDGENDNIRVELFVVIDTLTVKLDDVTGDVGYPVVPGSGKKVVWSYGNLTNLSKVKLKIVADDLQKVVISDVLKDVDTTRLFNKLTFIAANRHYATKKGVKHMAAVRDTIEGNFKQYGLSVSRQIVPHENYMGQNVIGKLHGQGRVEKVFIVTAHIDTEKKSVGADDNGSGIVGLLEAARVLSRYNFNHSIVFVGFDLEEEGWLGSKQYVFNGGIGNPEAVDGVINYDMIGVSSNKPNSQIIPEGFDILFPEVCAEIAKNELRGDFAVCTSNKNSETFGDKFKEYAGVYVPNFKVVTLTVHNNGEFTSSLAASDHVPFWRVNCKALHIGDGGETRNQYLDTPKDKIDLINFSFLGNIVKATVATIAELGGIQHTHVSLHAIHTASTSNK